MLAMPITINPKTEARLRERAGAEGQDVDTLADLLINMALEWEAKDREDTVDGIKRGLEAVDQGRFRSFAEFASEQRAKYHLPAHD
jgi:predicted transcriptional regulator